MKTFFSKKEQKWVSKLPKAYWLGIHDYDTGEIIYSDDAFEKWFMDKWIKQWGYPVPDAKEYWRKHHLLPYSIGINNHSLWRKSKSNEK